MSNQETKSESHYTESNDNIHVTVSKQPHCEIKFDITVTPKAVEASYQKTIKNVNKEVNIPGFRKGRAPDKMVLEKFAHVIQKEFVDLVLQTGFNEAIHLTHLHPLKDGHVKRPHVHECSREKGAQFTIEFEARPVIPSVKVEELEIKEFPRQEITDQDRQNAIRNLQLQFATYEPIEDRPAQENDFVNITVSLLGDEPKEIIENERTEINPTALPSWLRTKVIGLNAGESAEGMTEQDPSLAQKTPQFQSLPFRITVHSIWKGVLPAVDEELAKLVKLNTVEDLYNKINERFSQEIEEEAFKHNVRSIETLLIEKYPVDLPRSYIDPNKEARLNNYLDRLRAQNREWTEDEYNQIENSIEQATLSSLQLYFLLSKIASDNNITVESEDVTQELTRQISLISTGKNSVDFNDKDSARDQLHQLALERKIKQFLIHKATFKD